ncbi:MAG: hypothetical protein CVV27_08770, partial [Candidatus Melainabacteria bacterium HGW-Melainabacteria-1]
MKRLGFVAWLCLLSLWLVGCAEQHQVRHIPYPGITALRGWQYHWDDAPWDGQSPSLRLQQDTGWAALGTPLNPPNRQGRNWLWLRVRLPQLEPFDSLYLRGIDERFAVYARGREIYAFGELPPRDRYYAGFPWHMIPLTPELSGDWIYFRIHSSGRHIGIFGQPRIGSGGAHLQAMLLMDIDRLVVGFLLMFTGLMVLMLFMRQPIRGYRLLCLFAVSIGVYLICRTELKQLYGYAPAVWKWIEYLALFTGVPSLCLFLNRLFVQRGAQLWAVLIRLQIAVAAASLLLAALGVIALPDANTPFLLLTLLNMLTGLGLVALNFRQHGRPWLLLGGLLVLCIFTGYDILAALKLVPWVRPVSHWGLLFLLLALVALLKDQVDKVYHARRVAEEASRAKSEFLTSVSHEIRTPLNAILGFGELLSKEFKASPQALEYLQIIRQAGQTLLLLINDILDLSKIDATRMALRPRPTALPRLCEEIRQLFRLGMQQKGLDWSVEIAPGTPEYVSLDDIRLRQILLNLVG